MSTGTMKVATLNANSIRSRLELVLDWLRREAPDVLCLQETKVQDADFPAAPFRDAGYHVVFRGQKAHAGVAIVSQEEPQEVAFGLDDGGEPDEPRMIRAVIAGIPVVNTYVPQGRSPDSEHFRYKLEWLARLRTLFERHYAPQEPLLWMGDFNVAPEPIDVHDPKRLKNHVDFHPEARAALERVRDWGFVDAFRRHHMNSSIVPSQLQIFLPVAQQCRCYYITELVGIQAFVGSATRIGFPQQLCVCIRKENREWRVEKRE